MRKNPVLLLLTATALYWFSLYTYPVLLPGHAEQALGASPAAVGGVVGSYGLVQMLLRTPLGFASDRLRRRKPFLTLGMAMSMTAALGLYLARSPLAAMLARGAAGAAAASWVAFSVLYAGYGAQTAKGNVRAMGTLSAVMYGAQLAGTQAGGLLARAAGTRAAFLLAAAAGVLGIACSRLIADRRPGAGSAASPRDLLAVLKGRSLLACAALTILMQVIMWSTLYGFSPQWAAAALGADAGGLALLSTVHLLPNIVFAWLTGAVLAPRLGPRPVMSLGFALLALGCAGMPFTAAFGQMLALQALCGVGVGCVAPVALALCIRDARPERYGMAMGLYQSLYGIGMFAGPVLAGALVNAASPVLGGAAQLTVGYRVNFLAMAGVGALGAMLALLLLPRDGSGKWKMESGK
ncbi:MAG: MFS transporter [Clostridia bacterium]|nr:MFS transporter [Clostridia bacterium]